MLTLREIFRFSLGICHTGDCVANKLADFTAVLAHMVCLLTFILFANLWMLSRHFLCGYKSSASFVFFWLEIELLHLKCCVLRTSALCLVILMVKHCSSPQYRNVFFPLLCEISSFGYCVRMGSYILHFGLEKQSQSAPRGPWIHTKENFHWYFKQNMQPC